MPVITTVQEITAAYLLKNETEYEDFQFEFKTFPTKKPHNFSTFKVLKNADVDP